MNKTAKLIQWQRIAIWLLLCVAFTTAFMASTARRHEKFWREEIRYSDAEIGDLERRHDADQKILQAQKAKIEDLTLRLRTETGGKGRTDQATIERLLSEGKPLQSEVEHLPALR